MAFLLDHFLGRSSRKTGTFAKRAKRPGQIHGIGWPILNKRPIQICASVFYLKFQNFSMGDAFFFGKKEGIFSESSDRAMAGEPVPVGHWHGCVCKKPLDQKGEQTKGLTGWLGAFREPQARKKTPSQISLCPLRNHPAVVL